MKLRFNLIPLDALRAVLKVLGAGADKYGDHSWETRNPSENIDPMFRHYEAAIRGELDEETGLPAAAHLAARALFMTAYQLRGRWLGKQE